MLLVEADVSAEWEGPTDWRSLAERSVRSALAHSRHALLLTHEIEVSVKFTSDCEVRSLNSVWRGKDKPTNVLSFPMAEASTLQTAAMLGDIVLGGGVCRAEAAAKSLPLESHAAHLVVHGMLHLLGYVHEQGEAEAEAMEEAERRALAAIGVADPYQVTEVQSQYHG